MLQVAMNSKIQKTVYGVFLPIVVVFFLGIVASFINRPHLLGSAIVDFIVRIMLAIWFCGLYSRLSRFSTFSFFPNKIWSKSDIGCTEKFFHLSLIFIFSIGCGLITWWIILWFIPIFSNFAAVIAVSNSLVVLLPMATHYWVLKP